MPQVVYILADGTSRTVDVPVGTTVLAGALKNGVDGLLGECGGVCMCATCHVYVQEEFLGRLPVAKDTEEAVLEVTMEERQPNSRLSCQIKMTDELGGLTVRIPEKQR